MSSYIERKVLMSKCPKCGGRLLHISDLVNKCYPCNQEFLIPSAHYTGEVVEVPDAPVVTLEKWQAVFAGTYAQN